MGSPFENPYTQVPYEFPRVCILVCDDDNYALVREDRLTLSRTKSFSQGLSEIRSKIKMDCNELIGKSLKKA